MARLRARQSEGARAGRRMAAAVAVALAVTVLLSGCARPPLYRFHAIPRELPSGTVNLLSDPSFETPDFHICTVNCNAASGWSIEHTTPSPPIYFRSLHAAVTGQAVETLDYRGEAGDDGQHKDIELYHGAAGPTTTAGHRMTFTLWVSGTCVKCAPFIGIEAFNTHNLYLGESDQYFNPPARPRPVRVSFKLPAGTVVVAAYIQVPEIYEQSRVHLHVDNALLTSAPVTTHRRTGSREATNR